MEKQINGNLFGHDNLNSYNSEWGSMSHSLKLVKAIAHINQPLIKDSQKTRINQD